MTRIFTNAPHLALGGMAILIGYVWRHGRGNRPWLSACAASWRPSRP